MNMKIEQLYDKGLAHASYIVMSNGEMAVIDPARDPKPYLDYASANNAKIKAIIETHPHADFVSSHAELSRVTGAPVYVSVLVGADYPHKGFDEGDIVKIGKVELKSINTPGHSPDSISIILIDENKKEHAVFTGDTLFVGDVGRPDLREKAGNIQAKREQLAESMYHTLRDKLMKLPDDTIVYPAHGPGSLCGKSLSPELQSTIGKEKEQNYAMQDMKKDQFVSLLLEDQPFIPKYFPHDVSINKHGAEEFEKSIQAVPRMSNSASLQPGVLVVDSRPRAEFEKGHVKGAINIVDGLKFETWLGSIVAPNEKFYLIAKDEASFDTLARKSAKIGYEKNIAGIMLNPEIGNQPTDQVDLNEFRQHPDNYTIIDVRNTGEVKIDGKVFGNSLSIPLPDLRERAAEIPTNKPIVVHCAGGTRSSSGTSILMDKLKGAKIYDLKDAVKEFKN